MAGRGSLRSTGERVVLVVDDHPAILEALRRQRVSQIRVVTALDVHRACHIAEIERPSVAIVDLFLGSSVGVDLIPTLRAVDAHMKIVIASGRWSPRLASDVRDAGADDIAIKPFTLREVLERIDAPVPRRFTASQTFASIDEVKWEHVRRVYAANRENISKTARDLGVQRQTVRDLLKSKGKK